MHKRRWCSSYPAVLAAILLFSCMVHASTYCACLAADVSQIASPNTKAPIWSDEFDGAAGGAPDSSKWVFDIGGEGWGNHELETYTDSRANSYLDGHGNLVIKALQETPPNQRGTVRNYTSARLITKGKFAHRYGHFEARIKLPYGQGIWPAFWILGANIDKVGWPQCGEVDIMENIGKEVSTNHGSMHGPDYCGGNSITAAYSLPAEQRLSDAFHTYAIDWEPEVVRFYVDGNLYSTRTPADIPGKQWVFNQDVLGVFGVGVGGDWPGNPDKTTVFPQEMLVDYVRVYDLPQTTH